MNLALLLPVLLAAALSVADPTSWPVAGSGTLRLDASASAPARLLDPAGAPLHTFAVAERVHGSSVSPAGTCVLLLVMVERPQFPGSGPHAFDYGYLLRVIRDSAGGWRADRVLEVTSPTMSVLHRFVVELGRVTDDGKSAVLKFGEASQEVAPYRMSYAWQTRELDNAKLLGSAVGP